MTKKEASDKQEKMVANFLGWSQVAGSGARPTHVGDVECDTWLGECKTHVSPGHVIHFDLKIWDKIVDEASSKFKKASYFVDDGSQDESNTFVMISVFDAPSDQVENLTDVLQKCKLGSHSVNFNSGDIGDSIYRFKLGKRFVFIMKLSTFREVMWLC